jgi:hypothetical protein
MTDFTESFTVEYPCELACRIELVLPETHPRFNRRQMRQQVDDCHAQVHEGGPIRAEFTVANLRAGAR